MPSQDDPKQKLPVAADFKEIFNRINLNLDKRRSALSALTKHHQPSSSTTTTTPPVSGGAGGFSSLTSSSRASTPSHHHQQSQSQPQRERSADDQDLNPVYALPPNAGIGYNPSRSSSSDASRSAQDRDTQLLRRKVLGKNAARQLAEARSARNGAGSLKRGSGGGYESESEEEVGRGALVRSRGKGQGVGSVNGKVGTSKKRGAERIVKGEGEGNGNGEEEEDEEEVAPRRKKARVEGRETGNYMGGKEGEEKKGNGERKWQNGGEDVVMVETGAEAEGQKDGPGGTSEQQVNGEKKKKKKKKKKKNGKA
ncbi:hypothetical protein VTI74DRAFT_5247 [Chaetomium olivicolor]